MQENTTKIEHKKIAYSVKELSRLVGVCERKIHSEIKQGNLRTSRIGRRVLIIATEVNKWLEAAIA